MWRGSWGGFGAHPSASSSFSLSSSLVLVLVPVCTHTVVVAVDKHNWGASQVLSAREDAAAGGGDGTGHGGALPSVRALLTQHVTASGGPRIWV